MARALPRPRMAWAAAAALLPFLFASGARVPNANVIGADLLIRTTVRCDAAAAWRILGSKSFSPGWLTQKGGAGETPLMAAVRSGCGELVAIIMLHPDFDDSTVRRAKQRRELVNHAMEGSKDNGRHAEVTWAIAVVLGVRSGKVIQDELAYNPRMVESDGEWFLPKPGEWTAPKTLEELGIKLPMEPELAEPVLNDVLSDEYAQFAHNLDGTAVHKETMERLWYTMVSHIQTPEEESERRVSLEKEIRSIGWSLFFRGSKDGMMAHSLVLELLASFVHRVPGDGTDPADHIPGAKESPELRRYRQMAKALDGMWNMTGNWLLMG